MCVCVCLCVAYFDQLVEILFFSRFQQKSTKKRQFWGTPSASRPAFACRPALRSRQNLIFLFIFRRFLLISAVKSLKKVWNEQKRLKTAEKKYFNQLLGARSTQKLVKIHNTYPLEIPPYFIRFRGSPALAVRPLLTTVVGSLKVLLRLETPSFSFILTGKDAFAPKNMILGLEWHAKHPFAG